MNNKGKKGKTGKKSPRPSHSGRPVSVKKTSSESSRRKKKSLRKKNPIKILQRVVLIFIIVNGVDIRINALLFILNILELYVFALGIAFFLSALFVKYRDVSHIWEVLLQGLFYATPIIYPFAMVFSVSPIAAKAMLLSPIAQTIQDARFNLISPTVSTLNNVTGNVFMKAVPYVIVAIVVVVAVLYFRKNQKYFAENV